MKKETKFEVYGCWSFEGTVGICPKCASKLQVVPQVGHFNSKYWELKRNDGLDLYCCPNGCNNNFKSEIFKNMKPLDENILKYFYMMHNINLDEDDRFDITFFTENHTTDIQEHKRKVHYIFLKDFVLYHNGFLEFHNEYYSDKANVEFMIDILSGLVFFNIYSHEPFASNLYRPLYRNIRDDDRLGEATKDGLCIWKSTTSNTIFGLEESEDMLIKAKMT